MSQPKSPLLKSPVESDGADADVGARAAGDERLVRARAALELRIETLLAALTEGVAIIDATGVVTSFNDAAETILGLR